jgi:adenine-specific DNA-methyltransferase
MPTLDFKGKSFVYTHHLSVPFRELIVDTKKSELPAGVKPSLEGNLIIHGDNLHALKALLPIYAGKVDCIYIDPPYNTGNEGWCYNDNVRSPLMKEWLKKSANPVEKDDLERHDKWLCMMWPRLKLLHELLAQDAIIFISIDDNEVHRLRSVLDEVFGEDNFLALFARRTKSGGGSAASHFAIEHDYVLAYARHKEILPDLFIEYDEQYAKRYSEQDDTSRYYWDTFERSYTATTPYEIEAPDGTKLKGNWFKGEETFKRDYAAGDIRIRKKPDGEWSVQFKQRMPEGRKLRSLMIENHFKAAPDEVSRFGVEFNYPKPVQLLKHLLASVPKKNALILDSFAGSGTTAAAVLALNKKDGGNRKFILVEMEDYAYKATAARVRQVIKGYKYDGTLHEELLHEPLTWAKLKKAAELVEKAESIEKLEGNGFDKVTKTFEDGALVVTGEKKVTEKVEGLGGSFTFCTLGEEMSMDRLLAGDKLPSFDALAKYVFYTATGRTLADVPKQKADGDGFIGETDFYRVHLYYKPEKKWLSSNDAALTEPLVEEMLASNKEKKRLLVFAAAKFMAQKQLTRQGVEFCQLPYAIHRIMGD